MMQQLPTQACHLSGFGVPDGLCYFHSYDAWSDSPACAHVAIRSAIHLLGVVISGLYIFHGACSPLRSLDPAGQLRH